MIIVNNSLKTTYHERPYSTRRLQKLLIRNEFNILWTNHSFLHSSLKQKQDAWLTPGSFLPSKFRKTFKSSSLNKKMSVNVQNCIKTPNFGFFFKKTQVLARRKYFFRNTTIFGKFCCNFGKIGWKKITMNFCLIVQLSNVVLKKLNVELMIYLSYMKKKVKWTTKNIRTTSVHLGFRVPAPIKPRSYQTHLRKARSFSRWTLVQAIYTRKAVSWEKHCRAILSWIANPSDGLAQIATYCDLNQGPEKSKSNLWRGDKTWKTSALRKWKISSRKLFSQILAVKKKQCDFPQPLRSSKKYMIHAVCGALRQCSEVLQLQKYKFSNEFRLFKLFWQIKP